MAHVLRTGRSNRCAAVVVGAGVAAICLALGVGPERAALAGAGESCDEWVERASSRPAERFEHCTAFDSSRGVLVLYGGSTGEDEPHDDTWEWDGETWRLAASGGPGERHGAQMAFDSLRGVTVLFGGDSTTSTWEWDGVAWTELAVPGPGVRRLDGAMAFDSVRGVIVLYGGQANLG